MKLSEFEESKYGGGNNGDFLRLEEGDNRVRIVSEFAPRVTHFKKGPCTENENCPFCNEGDKPSYKFLCHVIERKTKLFKIAEFGVTIIKQLKQLSLDPEYKFQITPEYDVNIKRVGKDKETTYTVVPARENSPLTEEEKKVIATLKHPMMIVEMLNKSKKSETPPSTTSQTQETEEINVDDIPF